MLVFHVLGSAPRPYRVTALGAGATLRMTCTCPHGRRGLKSCKHRARLLAGDAAGLVDASPAALDALARLTGGAAAPAPEALPPLRGPAAALAAAYERHVDALEAAGWRVEAMLDPAGDTLVGIALHPVAPDAAPWLTLGHEPFAAAAQGRAPRRRSRPWRIRGRWGSTIAAWSDFGPALDCFLARAGVPASPGLAARLLRLLVPLRRSLA